MTMGERIDFDTEHVRVWDADDELVWSEDIRPINLLPDAFNLTPTIDMQYPSMDTSFAHVRTMVQDIFDNDIVACTCWGIILTNKEWGPGESSTYELPDIVLGTVPAGVNFLDVRVDLVRTLAPASYLNVTIDNLLPEEETFLPGGSMRLEDTPLWRRAAWIGLDGTNVVLRRWQSVGDDGLIVPSGTTDGSGNGWYRPVAGTYMFGSLQSQQTPHVWTNPGNSSKYLDGHCPPGTVPGWGARWQGTAVIRPGYIDV